jgi:hypothetical protein
VTGGTHCTQLCQGYPKSLPCFEEPADEDIPFFSLMNVLITLLLLITFYFFRGGVLWKSR